MCVQGDGGTLCAPKLCRVGGCRQGDCTMASAHRTLPVPPRCPLLQEAALRESALLAARWGAQGQRRGNGSITLGAARNTLRTCRDDIRENMLGSEKLQQKQFSNDE